MLTQTVFPPDIRLEKEIKSLAKAGHDLAVICNQYEKDKDPDFKYCKIIRIKALFNSVWLNKIVNFPFFLNPRYLSTVLTTIFRFKPEFIHAHDLPMMPIAILFGKLLGLPIIFDMHENYPEALKVFEKKGLFNFIFKNYRFAQILEKLCIKYADRIIVVVEENKDRLLSRGVEYQKIFIVSNTVDINTFDNSTELDAEYSNLFIDHQIILYTGTISPDRDLITPIKAMKYLQKSFPKLLLVIIGDGPQKEQLIRITLENGLENVVKFIGWVRHEKLAGYIKNARICTIPQPSNDFIDNTIPHKLFEYMSIGKPVLISDALPFKRIITETKAGLTFKSLNSMDFAEKVKIMISSNEAWGDMGRRAVEEKYNWENDSQTLIEMYNKLR